MHVAITKPVVAEMQTKPAAPSVTEDVYVFPTTIAQRRFWLLDQMQPGNPALNMPLAARLTGRLDRELLERSVNEIIRRHEILRTSFRLMGKDPVQVIHPSKTTRLAWFDLSSLPVSEQEPRVHELMLEEGRHPFVLTDGLFLRGSMIKLREDEHILMLTLHHIVCDGWSNGVLMREIALIYTALMAGTILEELPLQYADFAQWQEDWLAGPDVAEHHRFWQSKLRGPLPFLNLPTDRPRRPGRTRNSTIHTRLLPRTLSDAIEDLCNRENLTPFMVHLAAYAILINRYTGQTDIIIGTPAANRSQPELEGLIGLFSNPLVMRLDFAHDLSLRSLLQQVKDLSLEVLEHQSYPFERLIEEIQTDPRRSGLQWLEAYFVFQKAFMQSQQMGPVTLTPLRSISPGTLFEWMLGVLERPEGVRLQLEYNTDLFDPSTIDRMLHHFQQLLEIMMVNLDNRLDALPTLTPAEHQRLVVDWNLSRLEIPRDRCVHERFSKQAQKSPHAPAVQKNGQQLSYSQVDRRANQVAKLVKARACERNLKVGLVMDSSDIEFPACFLGVLKAGACCVVLDPGQHHSASLENLASQGHLDLIVLASGPFPAGQNPKGIPIVNLAEAEGFLDEVPASQISAEQPACVCFSATGRGVIISHQALLNSALVAGQELGLHNQDKVTGSLTEMLSALLAGATLVLPHRAGSFKATDWWQWAQAREITVAAMPTPRWHELARTLQYHPPGAKAKLRLVAIGGSPVSPNALTAWRQATAGRIAVVDRYLLTETAGAVAYTKLPLTAPFSCAILQPSANSQVYLLDDQQRPVPIGVPGEIYVGGSSLMSGYWPAPQTGESTLIECEGLNLAGGRCVKTGDTGRFLASGGIELLGRREVLEKTDGFRLELSEIRSVIRQHPEVWDAVVLPRELSGERQLIASVTTRDGKMIAGDELRKFVAERLPAYMVPAGFVVLSEMPITPAGKIAYQTLPLPDNSCSAKTDSFVAPSTQTEAALAKLWCKLLGVDRISIHANFFTVGGHSLMAVRMVHEIRQQLAPGMPVRLPFQYPTIRELAKALLTQKFTERKPELIELQAGSSGPEMFLIIDGDSVGLYKLSRYLDKELRLYASAVPLPEAALKASAKEQFSRLPCLEDLAAAHASLIKNRQPTQPVVLVGYCIAGMLAFEVAHQLQRAGIKVEAVLMLNTWMKRPTKWWLKKAWLRNYLGQFLRQGPLYLWRQSQAKLNRKKQDLAARHTLAKQEDLPLLAPQSIVDRINQHAVMGYQQKPLASRGVLFVFEDDWKSKAYLPVDSTLGARGLFADGLEVIQVPANNVTVLEEAHLATVAKYFNQYVRQFR